MRHRKKQECDPTQKKKGSEKAPMLDLIKIFKAHIANVFKELKEIMLKK